MSFQIDFLQSTMIKDKDKQEIRITIVAIDNGVVMGEDLELILKPTQRVREIAAMIQKKKHISPRRMSFFVPPRRSIPVEKWDKTIASCGLYDGTKINLHPTFPGCWQWEPQEYYIKKTLDKIINVIKEEEDSNDHEEIGILLEKIDKKVQFPPPLIREELLSFIRQYPEIFYVEVDTKVDETRVAINTDGKLPLWF